MRKFHNLASSTHLGQVYFLAVVAVLLLNYNDAALKPGGFNVNCKRESYYVTKWQWRTVSGIRRSCRSVCSCFLCFCHRTVCRSVIYYRRANVRVRMRKYRQVCSCAPGWQTNAQGDHCSVEIKCAPTGLLARSITTNSSLVIWDRPLRCDSGYVTRYQIYVETSVKRKELYVNGSRHYIDLLGLEPSTRYTVHARAVYANASGDLGFGVHFITKTVPTTLPTTQPTTMPPPAIVNMRLLRVITKGLDSTFVDCEVTGRTPLNFTWYKDGQSVRSMISYVESADQLDISSSDNIKAAAYVCRVQNEGGVDEKNIVINEEGRKSLKLTNTNEVKKENSSALWGISGVLLFIVVFLIMGVVCLCRRARRLKEGARCASVQYNVSEVQIREGNIDPSTSRSSELAVQPQAWELPPPYVDVTPNACQSFEQAHTNGAMVSDDNQAFGNPIDDVFPTKDVKYGYASAWSCVKE